MAKYLHRYKSREDFKKDYYGSAPVTAFTVTGGTVSPGCGDGDWVETHDFDGRYVFVEETRMTTTALCNGDVWTDRVRIFKKGDVALYDTYSGPEEKWGSELGYAAYIQDPSQVHQAGDAQLDVSNPEYGEPVYHEPWVSCTTDTEMLSGTADALYDLYSSGNVLLGTNITLTSMGRTGFYVDYSDQLV